ncbi:MAG: hypothetical protein QW806_06110 [Nitrososphaerota archaeon]
MKKPQDKNKFSRIIVELNPIDELEIQLKKLFLFEKHVFRNDLLTELTSIINILELIKTF